MDVVSNSRVYARRSFRSSRIYARTMPSICNSRGQEVDDRGGNGVGSLSSGVGPALSDRPQPKTAGPGSDVHDRPRRHHQTRVIP